MIQDIVVEELRKLKGETIQFEDPLWGLTAPLMILAVGYKRVHIRTIGAGSYYFTTLQFIKMIWYGYTILTDDKTAKYLLSEKEYKLLDI